MMKSIPTSHEHAKPVPGWTCLAIGVGFVVLVTAGLAFVLMAAG
jgi:hypothetical protein